jgi:hypothetical protein
MKVDESGPRHRTASVRSCERTGWQAKAPAPQARKRLRIKVGQTLSSVNPALSAFLSRLLSERPPRSLEAGRSLTLAVLY